MAITHVARSLGRTPRSHDPRIPHLSALLGGRLLPEPPPAVDNTAAVPQTYDWGMMLNDTEGDCTCAAFYHARQIWSLNGTGSVVTDPDSDVQELYVQACGYNGVGEGPGGNEQHVLRFLHKTGAPIKDGTQRDKILGYVEVDPRNTDDVKRTIANSGVAYIGFNVPANIMPSVGDPPETWDVDPSKPRIIGGHAVVLPGYDAAGPVVISWGKRYKMTWDFFAAYVDEVYAISDAGWVQRTGKPLPAGLSLTELSAQMNFV